jgi:hypothetical protein
MKRREGRERGDRKWLKKEGQKNIEPGRSPGEKEWRGNLPRISLLSYFTKFL